jgi:hypothetical protein
MDTVDLFFKNQTNISGRCCIVDLICGNGKGINKMMGGIYAVDIVKMGIAAVVRDKMYGRSIIYGNGIYESNRGIRCKGIPYTILIAVQ